MTVIFIVAGVQRTGTTLLASSLGLRPEINCLLHMKQNILDLS